MPEFRTIDGIVVKMKRKRAGEKPEVPEQWLRGKVSRSGAPVKLGLVALWGMRNVPDAPNAYVMRGRTTDRDRIVYPEVPICNGEYELSVPFQNQQWYVAAYEPYHSPTIIGPIAVSLNERKSLDIVCEPGGNVSGSVRGVPKRLESSLWAVAFTRHGYRAETRVAPDGTFRFTSLPPGEYGLKVGHDAYSDAEAKIAQKNDKASSKQQAKSLGPLYAPANPWLRAEVVRVGVNAKVTGVILELP